MILETDCLYLRGIVIRSNARAFKKKDYGRVSVMIAHDIAYDGQVLSWTRYVDPFEEPGVKMEGQEVLEFPRYENFKPILLTPHRSLHLRRAHPQLARKDSIGRYQLIFVKTV